MRYPASTGPCTLRGAGRGSPISRNAGSRLVPTLRMAGCLLLWFALKAWILTLNLDSEVDMILLRIHASRWASANDLSNTTQARTTTEYGLDSNSDVEFSGLQPQSVQVCSVESLSTSLRCTPISAGKLPRSPEKDAEQTVMPWEGPSCLVMAAVET